MALNAALLGDDRIVIETDWHHEESLKKINGAKWDKRLDRWTFPLTWTSCVVLTKQFGADLTLSDDLRDWGVRYLQRYVAPAKALRGLLTLDDLPPLQDPQAQALVDHARDLTGEMGLFPHQAVGAAYAAILGSCAIFDETGTGKTTSVIAAMRARQRAGESVFPALVVCPASVKTVWEREIAQRYPGLKVVVLRGTAAQRRKQLSTPAHVYIGSYRYMSTHSSIKHFPGAPALKRCPECDGLDPKITPAKCEAHERELDRIAFQTMIVDEAHRLLDPSTLTTRACWSIGDRTRVRIAMTGTPVQDKLDDYWSILRFVSPRDFEGKTKFLDRYAITGFNVWGAREIEGPNPATRAELDAITEFRWRRMLKEVVLPFLPPKVVEERMIEMTGAQAKAYKDMHKTMMAELGGKRLVTNSPLTKAARLFQFASSFAEIIDPEVSLDEFDWNDESEKVDVRLMMPSNKVTAFIEDIRAGDYDSTGAGVVVFAQSRQLLMLLAKEMDSHGIEYGMIVGGQTDEARQVDIDRFQAGEIKYILVSIMAGGAGITLTAADTMVFLQRSWSSTGMAQALARADRIGSERHDMIKIIHYLTEGTIEKKQLRALSDKDARIEDILRDKVALKRWMEESDA